MASQPEIVDLTQSDDDQSATRRRAPATIPPNAEIIEISDDEAETGEAEEKQNDDLVGPLLAAIANTQPNVGLRRNELQVERRAPILASPRRDAPFRGAEVVLNIFTDGSFINNRFGGAGVSWRDQVWYGRAIALGRVKSSFDAELHAILEGIKTAHAIVDGRPAVTKVIVQTDCESCIEALVRAKAAGGSPHSLLEEALRQEALLKSRNIEVKLWWVKGHSDSVGNDVADNLARYGSDQSKSTPASWGMMWQDPPSIKLDQANKLRHADRKPRKAVETAQDRRARKQAMRRDRMASRA